MQRIARHPIRALLLAAPAALPALAFGQACPGPGDCFQANGTPGCQDPECCLIVCSQDPFCCDVEWDGICAQLALKICTPPPAGDFDGDGHPDSMDNCPFVFNPGQEPEACQGNVTVEQLTQLDLDRTVLVDRSEHGRIGVTLPNMEEHLHLNAFVNGQWVVQNMLMFPTHDRLTDPFPRYATTFNLGVPRGQAVDGASCQIYVTPQGFPGETPPGGAPIEVITVTESLVQIGLIGENESAEMPVAENFVVEAGAGVEPPKQTKRRPDYRMIDLDAPEDNASCTPGAVASSFDWLNRTYCLGLEMTPQQILDDLKARMGVAQNDGVDVGSEDLIVEAKKALIRAKQLPLTVEFQGPMFTGGGAISVADLYEQMCLGQDVEVHYRWTHNGRTGLHSVSLIKMTKCGDEYQLTFLDDEDQSNPGSNDAEMTGPFGMEDGKPVVRSGRWKFEILGWTAESPTLAAITRAVILKLQELITAIDAAQNGGPIDALVDAIVKLAFLAEWLAERIEDFLKIAGYPENSPERSLAGDILLEAAVLQALADEAWALAGSGDEFDALAAARSEAILIEGLTQELIGLFPADADHDSVPDDIDNCELPNPDQQDLNGNGIGDVCELDGNDCNGNAIPDDADIEMGLSEDLNGNGVPDECETSAADVNGDGVVDVGDLVEVVLQWGPCPDGPCAADVNGDGTVDVGDLVAVVLAWS